MIVDLMYKLQSWLISRNSKKVRKCSHCDNDVIPIREVSVLNILFFIIIGIVLFFLTKNKLIFFLPIVLSILNSLLVKKKCPKCKKEF